MVISSVVIRKSREADFPVIAEMIRYNLLYINCRDYPDKVIKSLYGQFSAGYLKSLAESREIFVAVIDDRVVGTASLDKDRIYTVFVDMWSHGKGIGQALMSHLEALAGEAGVKTLQVPASLTALGFYTKLGYREVQRTESEESGRIVIMEKSLAP